MSESEPLQLFVEHVTHIDCGVLDAVDGLAGRTWLVDAVLSGTRGDTGMLFDFGPAKRQLKAEIDALVDHRLLIPLDAPGLRCDETGVFHLTTADGGEIDYAGPHSGYACFDAERITAALLTGWLTDRIRGLLPPNVTGLTLALRDEAGDLPYYNYCHGLRRHDGHCQRLGHGHRCRLAISVDGVGRDDLARDWAARWQGVFIGDRADLAPTDDHGRHRFSYIAALGEFSLTLAADRCVLIDGPPTIENIADHIAAALMADDPDHDYVVTAYEGVGKGAIARRGAMPENLA